MKVLRLYCSLILGLFLMLPTTSNAACVLTATCAGGNWSAAGTWTPVGCGAVTTPSDNCIIIIPACATVTVNINSPTYDNMEIYVYGTLDFGSGQKINMCPGYVKVFPGGELTGGTPGSKINICGATVWNGGSTTSGPIEFGGGTTLPIELVAFDANCSNGIVQITWTTATEINNDHFTMKKSMNGLDFSDVEVIPGAGNSTSLINYSCEDLHPYPGVSYYRLDQTDYNGTINQSEIVAVSCEEDGFIIYPNPVAEGENINLFFSVPDGTEVILEITDVIGRKIYSERMLSERHGQFRIERENLDIVNGSFFINASCNDRSFSKLLIVK